jgi:hypothetical protein
VLVAALAAVAVPITIAPAITAILVIRPVSSFFTG